MMEPALADGLTEGARGLGLELTDSQTGLLLRYADLIARWGRVYNLTALREPNELLTHHLLDSLAAVPPLRRQTGGAAVRVLDAGSGAGLPGLVFAIVCPELDVTCVDTVGKKAAFIQQAAAELDLRNVQARHARVERLAGPPFDVIASRAFASLADFTALTRHALAPGGVWMALKARDVEREAAALDADIEMFHVEPLRVPGLDAERCIAWLRRRPLA
jgi:16S rRNA (guanine527-N7)-methyltransferase